MSTSEPVEVNKGLESDNRESNPASKSGNEEDKEDGVIETRFGSKASSSCLGRLREGCSISKLVIASVLHIMRRRLIRRRRVGLVGIRLGRLHVPVSAAAISLLSKGVLLLTRRLVRLLRRGWRVGIVELLRAHSLGL